MATLPTSSPFSIVPLTTASSPEIASEGKEVTPA
jgi:hypothetical protein